MSHLRTTVLPRLSLLLTLFAVACSATDPSPSKGGSHSGGNTGGNTGGGNNGGNTGGGNNGQDGCTQIGTSEVQVATAGSGDEFELDLTGASAPHTKWDTKDNEALVLDVTSSAHGFIGNVVLHQGADLFTYKMHVGALVANETLSVKVSSLSPANAAPLACVKAALIPAATLGAAAEGLQNAPILKWPVSKRFDDLPVVVGWSKAKQHYEVVFTNENGGTVKLCGGGAKGMRTEIARWGRGADIEGLYTYGDAAVWMRCNDMVPVKGSALTFEAGHPVFYYGSGHNNVFENRGGYGAACGTNFYTKADGDIAGWNVQNPGNEAAKDAAFAITLRPMPQDLDALGFAEAAGRREALLDANPWVYRLTDSELRREGKADGTNVKPMDQYLYTDVRTLDVNGFGDTTCAPFVAVGGFVLRAQTTDGATANGAQITATYVGDQPGVKRVAIPLGKAYAPADFQSFIFDAYTGDGIFFLDWGDAFTVRPVGDNGAELVKVHSGTSHVNVYVDDGDTGCVGGLKKTDGGSFKCQGTSFSFPSNLQ